MEREIRIKAEEPNSRAAPGINNGHNTRPDSPPLKQTVTEWLEHGLSHDGHSPAVIFDQTLSYIQLHEWSNKTAQYLIDQGVQKGDRVGICLERSVEMIVSLVGILKSGAAYVPLDPNYPPERLEMMKEDAKLSLLITHKKFSDLFIGDNERAVCWEDIQQKISRHPTNAPSVLVEPEDIAYIIFTSGSTGRPKGISMPHRALANLIEWQLEQRYFKKESRALQYSSISFDVSFQEIATTLSSGGALFLIDDTQRRDPRILLQKIDEWEIERLFIPFVALRSLIEVATAKNVVPASLKEVITAGEQLRVDDTVRAFFNRLPHSILDNQYGPSETHVITAHLLDENPMKWPDLPPIGVPLKNSSVYLLDEQMQPVANGEAGELYLGGRNVAHGYIGRDDLTQEAFIKNPFDQKHQPILYKTGDLGRLNTDGAIEFLGRSDHQIKIRGYRIEPGEINTAGAQVSGVAQCITHTVQDFADKPRLITYYLTKKGDKVDREVFKSHLEQSLPDYMVPSFIVPIEEIPYTPSGKVDVKALPKPRLKNLGPDVNEKIAYKTETEARLARIWSEILGFETIPRTNSFFDLGGDSLLAVTLFLEIESEFGVGFPLSALVNAATIEDLSSLIEEERESTNFDKFRSLQLFQKGDKNNPPLFLIHGGDGNVLVFRELAEALGPNVPILAFQWSGWDGYRGKESILAMAKQYKDELRKARPTGPYRIGGYCVGGVIAIEVANMLEAEGAEVIDPILIIDSPNMHSQYFRSNEPERSEQEFLAFKTFEQELESKIPQHIKKLTSEEEPKSKKKAIIKNDSEAENLSFPRRVLKPFKKLPFYGSIKQFLFDCHHLITYPVRNKYEIKRDFSISMSLALSKPIPIEYRQHFCSSVLIRAIKKHRKSTYKGDILYFRSSLLYGKYLGLQGWWDDLFMGFEELCSGRFEAYVVGGNHNGVLKYPYTLKLIKKKMFPDSNKPV